MTSNPHRASLLRLHAAIFILGLFATACADASISGSWTQHDASTPLPDPIDPEHRPLNIDTTWELGGDTPPGDLTVTMDLEALGLTDAIELVGTYVANGSDLTLTFTGFVIDPASGNTSRVGEDGAQCIVLAGFAGTPVCFPTPQTHAYTTTGDTLTVTLDAEIAGELTQVNFTMASAE